MTVLTLIGLALQLAGTAIAGHALYEDYRDHAGGRPLLPAVSRAWGQIRQKLGLARTIHASGTGTAHGTAIITGTATGYATLSAAPGAPLEEQVMILRGRVERLTSELREVGASVAAVRTDLSADVAKVREHADTVRVDLTEKLNAFATGRVTAELFGLVLVGLGTVAGSVGSLI